MVFHTAPPQPASNARITCSPQFVGGALASQKGFGQRMPAKFVVRSAKSCLRSHAQHRRDTQSSALAISDGVHYLAAAVDAISAGEVAAIGRLPGGPVDNDAAAVQRDAVYLLEHREQWGLADSRNHQVA